jgi:drug/metabolite transporter (DMT)-like permease
MKKQIKAELALFSIAAVWGASFILMKNLLDYMPVFQYLSLRFITASIILTVIFSRSLKDINRRTIVLGIIIGLMLFGGMSLQVYGLQYTQASKSAFITGLNVIMVPVISAVFLKKKPAANGLAGVVLAVAGLFLLSGGFDFTYNKGDSLTLLCAACFALQIIFVDYSVSKEDVRLLAVIQMAAAAAACSFMWFAVEREPFVFNTGAIAVILYTGVLGTAFAFSAQTIAQKYTTPTRTALILSFEPVFGAIFALLVPNNQGITEKLPLTTLFGCLLIFAGMLTASVKRTNRMKVSLPIQD